MAVLMAVSFLRYRASDPVHDRLPVLRGQVAVSGSHGNALMARCLLDFFYRRVDDTLKALPFSWERACQVGPATEYPQEPAGMPLAQATQAQPRSAKAKREVVTLREFCS